MLSTTANRTTTTTKKTKPMALRRTTTTTNTRRRATLAWLTGLVAVVNLLAGLYVDELLIAGRIFQQLRNLIAAKQTFPELRRNNDANIITNRHNNNNNNNKDYLSWPEPPATRRLALGNDRKTIWGYWHDGEEHLSGFCQLAVESWRVRHPDWNIVILGLDNIHRFVSSSELPSTFYSLKRQHQSDLVRLAVMRRYGGLYLDASYVLFKSMDDLWDEAERNNAIYLTAPISIPYDGHVDEVTGEESYLPIPNNAFLLVPNPHNPVLTAWQNTSVVYLENPAYSMTAIKQHPVMQRVAPFMGHWAFGPVRNLAPYNCNLWTLADTLWFEPTVAEYVQSHVYVLPTLQWTFDIIMVLMVSTPVADIPYYVVTQEGWLTWLKRLPDVLRMMMYDEPEVLLKLWQNGNAMKVSSDLTLYWDEPIEFHISQPTAYGRMLKNAITTPASKQPYPQATSVGAYLWKPLVAAAAPPATTTTAGSARQQPAVAVSAL